MAIIRLASQVTLIYYIILFASAIRLRYMPRFADGFRIPGGNLILWILMSLRAITSFLALCSGFVAPDNLDKSAVLLFRFVMTSGLVTTICLPFVLLFWKNDKIKKLV